MEFKVSDYQSRKVSTVLEQDYFYSNFLLSHMTVTTNFNLLDDEVSRPLDRRGVQSVQFCDAGDYPICQRCVPEGRCFEKCPMISLA